MNAPAQRIKNRFHAGWLVNAKAADRQAADGIERLPLLLFPDGRTHADGEFIHAHAAGFGHEKMAELMHGDEDTEDENCEQNIHVLSFQKRK